MNQLTKYLLLVCITSINLSYTMDRPSNLKEKKQVDLVPPKEIQKKIAQDLLTSKVKHTNESILEYLKKQSIVSGFVIHQIKQIGGTKINGHVPLYAINIFEGNRFKQKELMKENKKNAWNKDIIQIIDTKNNNQVVQILDALAGYLWSSPKKVTLNKSKTISYIEYNDGTKQQCLIKSIKSIFPDFTFEKFRKLSNEKTLKWLTNKLSGQKTFLLPDQARIILDMYQADIMGEKFKLASENISRYLKIPQYVRDTLEFYLGTPEKKSIKEMTKKEKVQEKKWQEYKKKTISQKYFEQQAKKYPQRKRKSIQMPLGEKREN